MDVKLETWFLAIKADGQVRRWIADSTPVLYATHEVATREAGPGGRVVRVHLEWDEGD